MNRVSVASKLERRGRVSDGWRQRACSLVARPPPPPPSLGSTLIDWPCACFLQNFANNNDDDDDDAQDDDDLILIIRVARQADQTLFMFH